MLLIIFLFCNVSGVTNEQMNDNDDDKPKMQLQMQKMRKSIVQ